jgi:hypothetical protein
MRMQARHGFVCCVCGAGYARIAEIDPIPVIGGHSDPPPPTQCKNLLSSISVRHTKHREKIKIYALWGNRIRRFDAAYVSRLRPVHILTASLEEHFSAIIE